MTSWSLVQNGDRIEKKWGVKIMERFPLYETCWALHVVPLTYRVSDPACIYVRSTVHKDLRALATASYGVFVHLAACHEQLESDPDLFAAVGIYPFYSRLYSVGELVEKFLGEVRPILRRYGGTCIPERNRRLDYYGTSDLSARFKEAFDRRAKDYRGQQVHDWGFPVIGQKIPRRKYCSQWQGKDLGELDAFLKQPGAEVRMMTEFVEAIQQAREDMEYIETVVNEVWMVALKELETLSDSEGYRKAQNAGASDRPPQRVDTTQSVGGQAPSILTVLQSSSLV